MLMPAGGFLPKSTATSSSRCHQFCRCLVVTKPQSIGLNLSQVENNICIKFHVNPSTRRNAGNNWSCPKFLKMFHFHREGLTISDWLEEQVYPVFCMECKTFLTLVKMSCRGWLYLFNLIILMSLKLIFIDFHLSL